MGTAAELFGLSHLHHAHRLAVLFPEQRHRTGLFCFLHRHNLCHNRNIRSDPRVYKGFHLCDLLRRHRGEMAEVKPQPVGIIVGACLFHMLAQHFPQRFLQKVGCAVILTGAHSTGFIHMERCPVAGFQHTLSYPADMPDFAAKQFHGIFYLKLTLSRSDHAVIPCLSAHGSIKRRLFYKDRSYFTIRQGIHDLALRRHHRDFGIISQTLIPYKFRCHGWIDGLIDRGVSAHIICYLPGSSRLLFLLLHTGLKALFGNGKSFLLQNLLRQIKREAEGIIKFKGILARQFFFMFLLQRFRHLIQNAQPLVDRTVKLVLFLCQHI